MNFNSLMKLLIVIAHSRLFDISLQFPFHDLHEKEVFEARIHEQKMVAKF